MASEMIDKIFEAEKNASKEMQNAQDKAEKIIEKAKTDAKVFENEVQGETAAQTQKIIDTANNDAQKILEDKISEAKNDADVLCNNVQNKKQAALESVVDIITLG